MREDLELQLIKEFPGIFKNYRGDPTQTCMAWGIDTDDGWFDLLKKLCRDITAVCDTVVAEQIKEKFGGLRFYYSGGNCEVRNLVAAAEDQSYNTCEFCGATENVECRPDKGRYWIKALCCDCRGDNE